MPDLEGKIAWVTGGARGIGAAVSLGFAKAGAAVAVMDIDGKAIQAFQSKAESAGLSCRGYQGDVTDAASIARVVTAVEADLGPVSILVNNAGIIRDNMFQNMTAGDWQRVLDVNLTGTFLCTKTVIDAMAARGFGRVINTSSISSLGNRGQVNYASAKAGIIGLTRTLALEYARSGVTVNCVAPGATDTEMTQSIPEEARQRFVRKIPMGRLAEPEEIAAAHLFLAGSAAAYITGQVLFVDGGISVGF